MGNTPGRLLRLIAQPNQRINRLLPLRPKSGDVEESGRPRDLVTVENAGSNPAIPAQSFPHGSTGQPKGAATPERVEGTEGRGFSAAIVVFHRHSVVYEPPRRAWNKAGKSFVQRPSGQGTPAFTGEKAIVVFSVSRVQNTITDKDKKNDS